MGIYKRELLPKIVSILLILLIGVTRYGVALDLKIIEGRVVDKTSGTPIDGVFLQIDNETYVTHTDERGIYRFRYITPGKYEIQVSCPGYKRQTLEIMVSASENKIRKDVSLEALSEIRSTFHQGQISNYTRQLRSLYPTAIVPYQQIDWLGDANISESLQFLPGVNVKYGIGQVDSFSIRGVGMEQDVVIIDGMAVISQSLDSRFPNLAGMSGKMFTDIELIRNPGPDMTAEELGGVVNLRTSRPPQGHKGLSVYAMSNFNGSELSLNPNLSFRYNSKFNNFGIVTQGQYRKEGLNSNRTSLTWKDTTMIQQQKSGITVMEGDYWQGAKNIERYGASGEINFSSTLNSLFYIRGLYTAEGNSLTSRNLYILPFSNLKSGSGTMKIEDDRFIVENGSLVLQPHFSKNRNRLYMAAGGGEHSFRYFDMDYAFAYSNGLYTTDRDRMVEWTNNSADFIIDGKKFEFPEYQFTDQSYSNAQSYIFSRNVDHWQKTENSLSSGELNLMVPFSVYRFIDSRIKFGGRYEYRTIDRGNSLDYHYDSSQLGVALSDFSSKTNWDVTGTTFGEGPNLVESRWNPWFNSNKDVFQTRTDLSQEAFVNAYELDEKTWAGYLMGEFEVLGKTTVAAGVRIERTIGSYNGNRVERINTNTVKTKGDTTITTSNHSVIPSIFIKHNFTDRTMLNVSLATGKKRPNYMNLIPWQQIDPVSRTVTQGNPNLKSERVLKGQIEFSHILNNLGFASVLFYFTELSEVVVKESKTIWSPAKFAGWRSVNPINSDIIQNFGAEATLNSPLSFLPGPFNRFSVYTNVRYLLSLVQVSEPLVRTVNFPGITPWELNLGVEYNRGKLSSLLQVHYSPPRLYGINAGKLYKVYMDEYQKGELTLDFLCRYRLSGQIQLFANFKNLTNTPRNIFVSQLATADDPLYNPAIEIPKVHNHYLDNGRNIQIGTQVDF